MTCYQEHIKREGMRLHKLVCEMLIIPCRVQIYTEIIDIAIVQFYQGLLGNSNFILGYISLSVLVACPYFVAIASR